MMEFRRLRAVLLLSLVSGIAWGTLLVLWILGSHLVSGAPVFSEPLLDPFLVFGFFGLIAGALFSLGLGLASSRGRARITRWWGALFGGGAGALVSLGLAVTLFTDTAMATLLWPMMTLTGVGGCVGFLICHVAARKELLNGDSAGALPPG